MTDEEIRFFEKRPEALPLYRALREEIFREIEDVFLRVQKTQITFCNRHVFACVSFLQPKNRNKKLGITVSFGLGYKLDSPRIAAVASPYPARCTHHCIVERTEEVDDTLLGWIRQAAEFSAAK